MVSAKEKALRKEVMAIGRRLYSLRLVSANTGNLSARLDKETILITATGSCLGHLEHNNILRVSLEDELSAHNKRVSSEFPLHRFIHKNLSGKKIIHCHPPLVNAYFSVYPRLSASTPEAKLYLGEVKAIRLATSTISRPELVLGVLRANSFAVIRNHGVVSAGETFTAALALIETLETAVKVLAVARLFKKKRPDILERALKENLT